jgi:hypothetical protein
MKNYTNQAVKIKLLDVLEISYLSLEEQKTLILIRRETNSLEDWLEC